MGRGYRLIAFALRVGEQRQWAAGGDLHVQLPQAAGSRIPGVGENLAPRFRLRLVQRQEIGLGHEDLATDFDQRRCFAMQPVRHAFHRAQIGRDVFTFGSIASGGAAHETPVLVGQVNRQPIDFRFGHEHQRFGPAKEPLCPGAEFGKLGGVEGVVE